MRSSKSRSRNKSNNRNRSVGNIVNRVFDSSGPEGKVRGTPQQIIEKYNQLARDAQLSGDRVATENFQQHAEHYTRLLAEAQREQDARREQQEAQQQQRREKQEKHQRSDDRQSDDAKKDSDTAQSEGRNRADADRGSDKGTDRGTDSNSDSGADTGTEKRTGKGSGKGTDSNADSGTPDTQPAAAGTGEQPDVIDLGAEKEGSALVETPEDAPKKPRRPRRKKTDEAKTDSPASGDAPEAAE
ncbi:DUF4167 domain-containing protein [Aliiroseovarius sp. PTFE2010]|uniref:DUF4167 domain-containing protein n=1 Tax=Aliiroseovarius sp. PTFE2010 TaxID=3417190 RepID=UPI003CEBD5B1